MRISRVAREEVRFIHIFLDQNKTKFSLQFYSKVLQVVRSGGKLISVLVESTQTGVQGTIGIKNKGHVVLSARRLSTIRILINAGIETADQIAIRRQRSPQHNHLFPAWAGLFASRGPIKRPFYHWPVFQHIYSFVNPLAAGKELVVPRKLHWCSRTIPNNAFSSMAHS